MTSKSIILVSSFVLFSSLSFAAGPGNQPVPDSISRPPARMYQAIRLSVDKPVIDGKLDDACWKTGEWAGDFIQWIPSEGGKPSQQTELKILYDNTNIYVAIRAFDTEPDRVIRKMGRRDELTGDAVGINFDSYHDHRTGFEFNVTAAGQKADVVLTNPMNADFNWNAVWYVKTGVEDSAWTAEYEIPLSQLRYSSDEQQVWGLHCWRWLDRLQEESDWERQSQQGPGMLYLFGHLNGISGLPASRRIEIMPYTLGKLKMFQREAGNPYAENGRTWLGNAGLDAKIGLSSNFTADIAINPDFGQVESDPSVMNLTAFETFYEEKRPFFLEGKNIFDYTLDDANIFYSRRIGHLPAYTPTLTGNERMSVPDYTTILSAMKISGKTANGFSVGVLQSVTANEKAKISLAGNERQVSVEPMTNYVIARVQQDYGEGNTILGGILTSTNRFIKDPQLESMNRNAFTGGLDLYHQWNDKEYYVDAKLAGSSIRGSNEAMNLMQNSSARYYGRPDLESAYFDSSRTQLSGFGGTVEVGKGSKGLWRYSTELTWRSPGLDFNDVGYMQTADIVKQNNELSYFVIQPESIFRTYNIGFTQTNTWDYGLTYLSSGGILSVYAEFLNKWSLSTCIHYTSKALDTRILRGGPAMYIPPVWMHHMYVKTDPSRDVYLDLNTSITMTPDKSTRFFGFQPGIYFMPTNALKFSVTVHYNTNVERLQYIDTKQLGLEKRYLLGTIDQHTLSATFRIDYNITPEISLQYYGSPFATVGKYSEFKSVTNPKGSAYDDRFTIVSPEMSGSEYVVRENGGSYTFANPDFNFSQFRSNLVLRWEYLPGSQVYLVWSNERTLYSQPGKRSAGEAMRSLPDVYPNDIFLLKFSYWLDL